MQVKAISTITTIDIDGWALPETFYDAIKDNTVYRDQILKDHMYNIDDIEYALEEEENPELIPHRELIAELRKLIDQHNATYFRLRF